ncbi:uncharacterized protein LOC124417400 isoform X1 [Gallus gallus]|uniref:uncharacterized protein LOC124417400 isoform X1 n=1 Tax=Gallus gallus TaxID=9031 RepID=UPI001F013F3D|nr:uncharacterized protein LOC124417400 isoform X1 [Gallus gallus]
MGRCRPAAGGLRPRCSHGAQVSEGGSARPGSFRDCAGRPGRRGGSKGTPYPGRTAAISGRVGGRRRRRELRALWGGSLAGVCVQTDCSFSPRFSNFSFSAGCSGLKGSLSRVSSLWHLSDVRAEVPLAGFLAVAFVASVNKLPGYCVEFRLPLIIVKPRRDLFEVEGHHPAGFATRLIKNAHSRTPQALHTRQCRRHKNATWERAVSCCCIICLKGKRLFPGHTHKIFP